jgi:hypothetical protein
MATFQSEYETSTNAIDSIVSTQLSSVSNWLNIPGGLTKVSSSASGFVWGYQGDTVYICELPCTGNWKSVDLSPADPTSILDITTDDTNVYVLFLSNSETNLLVTDSRNQGTKTVIKVPFAATEIFSTHTYIWAQDSENNKQKCAKPCTMPNWQTSDASGKITSTDTSIVYGLDVNGNAVQVDENISSPWKLIDDIKGTIYGKGSDGTLYGIDSKDAAFKFDGTISPIFTNGLNPTNMSVNSQSGELWMTTSTPGDVGNIFMRSEKPDYSTIMNSITPLDRTRDRIADTVETKYERQTDIMVLNKQVEDIVTYFKKMFNIDSNTAKLAKSQSGGLYTKIKETQSKLDQINTVQPILIGFIVTLLAVCSLYLVGSSLLGNYTHILALSLIIGGAFLTTNFSAIYK